MSHLHNLKHHEEARQKRSTRKGFREIAQTTQQTLHFSKNSGRLSSVSRVGVVVERTGALRQRGLSACPR